MRAVATVVLGLLLAACAADSYPLPSAPPHTSQRNPATVGQPTNAVLLFLEVRPGDRIELLGADAIGAIDGATVKLFLSRPVVHDDGTKNIGEKLERLDAAVVTAQSASRGPDNAVGIVGQLTAQRAGRFEVTGVRLRYRVNGGGEQVGEGIDVVWTVCADNPAPKDCPE